MMERKQISEIIDEAYELYMPQVKSEITTLTMMVQDLVCKSVPPKILEIGTKYGGTFYIWNSLVSRHNGLTVSIDMNDGGLHGGISDENIESRNLWFKERFENCHFVNGNSHLPETRDQVTEILKNHANQINQTSMTLFDFLFIDGDHTLEGVQKDFEMYSSLVRDGGIIAFHDIVDSQRHRDRNVHVASFWNQLNAYSNSSGIFNYHFRTFKILSPLIIDGYTGQDWAGIGLIQKIN